MGQRRLKRRREERRHNDDEPFVYLTIKVGVCILSLGWVVTQVHLFFSGIPSYSHSIREAIDAQYADGSLKENRNNERVATFPVFDLDAGRSQSDAFGINDNIETNNDKHQLSGLDEFYNEVSQLKQQFISLYDGENAARYLIHSGVTTFNPSGNDNHVNADNIFDAYDMQHIPSGVKHTAYRILSARYQNRPFKIAFGGYSVTVGRGNYFNQSYPFVLEKLLSKPMKLLGIELQVRNAAIGGVPSFPYGWCLDNFLGDDVDVISWDYSMNEAGGIADGLEAYIRHGLSMKRQPMLIVKDTSTTIAQDRYDLIQRYVFFSSYCILVWVS